MQKTLETVRCNTVGDLLDALTRVAKDTRICRLLDATIDGPYGETFTGFRILENTLSDGSTALDFELLED